MSIGRAENIRPMSAPIIRFEDLFILKLVTSCILGQAKVMKWLIHCQNSKLTEEARLLRWPDADVKRNAS